MRIAPGLPSKSKAYDLIAWGAAVAFGLASVLNLLLLLAVGLGVVGAS